MQYTATIPTVGDKGASDLAIMFPPSLGQLQAAARADVLGEWLGGQLGVDVAIEVAETYEALRESILDASVDLAWAPPTVCAQVEPFVPTILKAVRRGQSTYRSALVARGQEIDAVGAVRGKRAAWVDRLSVGGYQLPVAHLRSNGIEPDRDLAWQRFYGSYGEAVRAVLAGEADVTAVYSAQCEPEETRRHLFELVGPSADALTVIGYTLEAPSDGLVVTRRFIHRSGISLDDVRPLVDGSRGHTFMLSILEADALVDAEPDDYRALRSPA